MAHRAFHLGWSEENTGVVTAKMLVEVFGADEYLQAVGFGARETGTGHLIQTVTGFAVGLEVSIGFKDFGTNGTGKTGGNFGGGGGVVVRKRGFGWRAALRRNFRFWTV